MIRNIFIYFTLLNCIFSYAQKSTITGVILDELNNPIENVNIICNDRGTVTDSNGFYKIEIESNSNKKVAFTHINFKKVIVEVNLNINEVFEFNPVLKESFEQISTVIINSSKRASLQSILNISPEKIRTISGAQAGIENILKTLPGFNANNELSTQYSVRGGNYDENLVYVNGMEVYRPFLIRSGQQEGLSFINSELTDDIKFSAGGFEAKYGDKMSSVLDIKYKEPQENKYSVKLNFLGMSNTFENVSKNKKFSNLLGFRYRNNELVVKAKETKSNFNPSFIDFQNLSRLKVNERFSISGFFNYSENDYRFEPITRQTNFGTLENPQALVVYFDGNEKDNYKTFFNSILLNYKFSENLNLNLITSFYNTSEKEYFDILAQYNLATVNSDIGSDNLGNVEFSQGIGSQLNHARNNLNAEIFNIESKIQALVKKNNLEISLKFTNEKIADRIVEWEVIDSAGFLIDPPFIQNLAEQPYEPNEGPIVPYQNIRSKSNSEIKRLQFYSQLEREINVSKGSLYYNIGFRSHFWSVNNSRFRNKFSPRFQIGYVPRANSNLKFNFKYGLYYQPPFYKELRGLNGEINPSVEAQKSIHLVFANEYKFIKWNRPFKLTSEVYHKNLTNLNPYTLENVRIRYIADNIARGYAYGMDLRINGEFVEGTESWFSFGYLKTEENIDNNGYIPRPTDQRLKFGILFQDYVPNIPNLKMFINLVYNTGLPGGSPTYADPYQYRKRLPDYKRADLGISYVLKKNKLFKNINELSVGLEIFNMFNIQNSITNTWVRDVYTKRQYSIPNYLTPRIFNFSLGLNF